MRASALGTVVAVNVVLAGALAFLWHDAERTRWSEPAPLPPSLEDVATAVPSEPVDVSRYRETLERALFAANRRMAPRSEAPDEAQAADSLKDVRLLGTYGSGERGGVIIVQGGQVQRVAIGESIGGWKVAAGGSERSAELIRANGQRRQLELALNNVAPAAAAAAAKGGAQEGAQPPAAGQPAATAAGPESASGAASQRASTGRTGWRSRATSPEARQQRLDRINQRRAARGQPPLQQRN